MNDMQTISMFGADDEARVGMARCPARAAFSGAKVPPAAARTGTLQRDVPTYLRFLCLLPLLGALTLQAAERAVRVNLGTLAPRGSSFHQALQAMGEQWRQAPGGGVRLVIYPDGTQGGEADMVRLMRLGSLHAGLLSAVGLAEIEPGVGGLQNIPMGFRTLAEFEYVNEKLRPMLEKRLAEKGFVVLFWGDAGWVRYFSTKPMLVPDDLKKNKVFVWAGNPDQVDIMKKAGYKPVPLETADIVSGLTTGLITAVTVPPIIALVGGFEKRAPHMIDLNWAPLVGACVIKKNLWDKLPGPTREAMLKAAAEAGKQIRASNRKESEEAVEKMKKNGLTVHTVSPEVEAKWRAAAEEVYPQIRGRIVPADIFDEAIRLLKEYRASGGKK
jgi:TRAP-type C4-dicarboxylate transport system substrate-binding protein